VADVTAAVILKAVLNPSSVAKVLVRATNWLGDAVMSLPAVRAIRQVFPQARLAVVARPWVADLYAGETAIDEVIVYRAHQGLGAKREFAARLREQRFECAILLQNAFDAALMAWMARIHVRIGYNRDARGLLLTRAVPVPEPGEIPRHERFYYLELLRRAGLIDRQDYVHWGVPGVRLEGIETARDAGTRRLAALGIAGDVVGISPGAAYGNAKRWLPERFAETAARLCSAPACPVLVFGSAAERALCGEVAGRLQRLRVDARNLAGETSLREFIELAAACRLFLTNDSGAMHVASALGVPTVAVFGATDDTTTGPTGPLARVVREHAECSPCLLRECPIDHRCMTRVEVARVTAAASLLLDPAHEHKWTQETKS
jgi:lipopolysaccharide heptosyltransferase II